MNLSSISSDQKLRRLAWRCSLCWQPEVVAAIIVRTDKAIPLLMCHMCVPKLREWPKLLDWLLNKS